MPQPRELPVAAAVGRKIRSESRVQFSWCDAYRHMGAAAYLELALDHRMSAVLDQLGFDTLGLAERTGLAFVVRDLRMKFAHPARLGDMLLVESWIERLEPRRMLVELRIRRRDDGRECCRVQLVSVLMDLARGAPVAIPERLPSGAAGGFDHLPWAEGHPRAAAGGGAGVPPP